MGQNFDFSSYYETIANEYKKTAEQYTKELTNNVNQYKS